MNGALLCEEILRDVEAVLGAEQASLLTLREAAARSGYSEEHLGKLIRQGALPNAGRKGSPRVRVGDLPKKPRSTEASGSEARYDPQADARHLASRRRG